MGHAQLVDAELRLVIHEVVHLARRELVEHVLVAVGVGGQVVQQRVNLVLGASRRREQQRHQRQQEGAARHHGRRRGCRRGGQDLAVRRLGASVLRRYGMRATACAVCRSAPSSFL